MKCRQVRANLAHYQAKEYYLFNPAEIEEHLAYCASCRAELSALAELDSALSCLPDVTAPPDFVSCVAGRIKNSAPAAKAPLKQRIPARLIFYRDLAAAAAVTLAIFLNGGGYFDHQNFSRAAQNMNAAVLTCLRTSGAVVNQAYDYAGNISPQLLLKELKQNEMRSSQ